MGNGGTDDGTEALSLLQSFDWTQEDCEDAMEELADELMEKDFYLYVQTQDHQVIMEDGMLLDSQEDNGISCFCIRRRSLH
ncbi:MAG: hypothetical protein LIO80_08550 [Lachnospiraceae bacterium]|nr:hypothetical protein [Lachnospiraceae bacterium]